MGSSGPLTQEHLARHFFKCLMKRKQKYHNWYRVESPKSGNNWRPRRPTLYLLCVMPVTPCATVAEPADGARPIQDAQAGIDVLHKTCD